MPGYSEVSERARQRVDDEKRRIVREAHEDAVQLLSENRHRLDGLAEALGGHCVSLRRTSVGPFDVDDADPERIIEPADALAALA